MRTVIIAVLMLLSGAAAQAGVPVVPTDGMVITVDTTFVPGTYMLPNGVHIGASGVTLDLNGATLLGTAFTNAGVTCLGHDDVVIRNGAAAMYYYGVRIESGSNITVESCVLSGNYVDPASKGPTPPFLNINVGPVIPNFTNLGGGLYARAVDGALIRDNVLRDQENGIDGYTVTNSTICGNDASDNTGWGIHLNGSTNNLIDDNIADRCTRIGLGDSAGLLLVMGSHDNTITGNSFRHSGDGFFIGNENGCPSNDNLVAGNDGSNAGANAFEATFSSGNRFLGNTANASNYGFWLGYSHSGTEVSGNEIRANNTSGIEIEHGQDNVIIGNTIIGNGGSGIVLRTDNVVHFPAGRFPCLALPNQAASSGYEVRDNIIKSNFGRGFDFTNTTASAITNNLVAANAGGSASSNGAGNTWSVAPTPGVNIVGGPTLGGNYWSEYAGVDRDADGLGDTLVPFTNGGQIAAPGDPHPLIGDPEIDPFDNPMSLCSLAWVDYGRNRRTNGAPFDTANGTHFATDGVDLLLLEGTNDSRLSRFNPATLRYDALANAPEAVWDGGDLQWAGLRYFATVGIAFDVNTGAGKGAKMYRYDPGSNTWTAAPDTMISGARVANEALAYDPVSGRMYATIVEVMTGRDASVRRGLAIYRPETNAWLGVTPLSDTVFGAGSEAEVLDGRVYVWRGGFGGGAVSGADSFLHVYDIGSATWSTTPSLQDSGILPGFRSGAFDIWGVTITSDAARGRLFVSGGEANANVYVFDVATQAWTVAPIAVYDGGWGDGLEYVASSQTLYQIDGRNAAGAPQGTAGLEPGTGDLDGDGVVGPADLAGLLAEWGECADPCCPADLDESGDVGPADLATLLGHWG